MLFFVLNVKNDRLDATHYYYFFGRVYRCNFHFNYIFGHTAQHYPTHVNDNSSCGAAVNGAAV